MGDRNGERFAQIAHDALRIVGGNNLSVWLYMEADDGWLQPALFQDRPDAIQWFETDADFFELVMKAWYAEAPDRRWASLEMYIADGRFTTRLCYHDEVPADDGFDASRRQEAAQAARFGNKRVIYPD